MSINPVSGIVPVSEVAPGEAQPRARQSQSGPPPESTVKTETPPDSGTRPKQENPTPNNEPAAAEIPQDEVELQQDSEIKDQVIIKYLDKSTGGVVLQVPSQQVLAVARGIYEDFQKQAVPHDPGDNAATVSGEGEKPNGN
jgi:hypothetical protein